MTNESKQRVIDALQKRDANMKRYFADVEQGYGGGYPMSYDECVINILEEELEAQRKEIVERLLFIKEEKDPEVKELLLNQLIISLTPHK